MELDPNCAEAFEALAESTLYFDWVDWADAERNFQRALSSNPNLGMAHRNYSWYLNLMGYCTEGIKEIRRAVEIDPQSPLFHMDLGWQLGDARQTDKAKEEARRSLECDAQFPFAYWLLANIYMEQSLFTEAIASAEKAAQGEPNFKWLLAQVYAKAGRKESALQVIEEIKRQPSPLANWGLAQVYATMGERDESLKWLERSFQDRFSLLPWSHLEDSGLQRPFKPFRSDPRYQELIHKMNLSDAAAGPNQ